VDLEISQPVMLQGVVVIPTGATAWGAVQDVKKGKSLRFDVEGVRLPNQALVKLRCSPQKTTHAAKDEIKVETQLAGDLGAPKGSEFTVYLDQEVNVDEAGTPVAAPAPAVAPQPAAPASAPVTPAEPGAGKPASPQPEAPAPVAAAPVTPQPPPPSAPPTPVAAPVSAPSVPPAAPVAHPAPLVQPGDYITVECFSDPLGADILIDDEFHGSTPSILKLPPGSHQIEYRLVGYTAHFQALNLTPGTGLRTVRITLEKLP
jgi:hypothetical protein